MIELTPAIAAHIAVAIRAHVRTLRRDGVPVPAALVDLADTLLSGQERPKLGCWCGGQETNGVVGAAAAASRLGVSSRTLRRLASIDQIPQVRIGRRVSYRREDLDQFLAAARRRTGRNAA